MTSAKKLGIWMDHATAHLMEFTTDPIQTKIIDSKFTHEERANSLSKNENLMHNKEKHQQSEYYKMLGEAVKKFDFVLLFGPTDAKTELLNKLKADHRFAKIKIESIDAGKMTENQKHAFVRDHFSKP